MSEEALQTAMKRSEKQKSKGKIYPMNAEFRRIARRDKKAFLSDQCKEIEENNGMGKTRDPFKKIRYQGNISCKNGLNKGQKWYGPSRSRRGGKNTQKIHRRTNKNDLHDPDNHDGMITHLEPDILEWEVKWAFSSITMNKTNGGDGIPVELFQILKDNAMKVLHSICQQIWKTQQWPQDWKRSAFQEAG